MTAVAERGETVAQKGLSEWWSEETEYVFRRIERWAAFARGYNRLRSQRWSKGRSKDGQQVQEHHRDSSWNVSSRKPSADEATSRFYKLERSRRKARPEEAKINCCGTFNYQSNSELDSNCLETYRYDHSIYFKTIGDIRRDVGHHDVDRVSISSEELVEWDAGSFTDPSADKPVAEEACNNNHLDNSVVPETETTRATQNAWPVMDFADLNLTYISELPCSITPDDYEGSEEQWGNNNVDNSEAELPDFNSWRDQEDREDDSQDHERTKRFRSLRETRRSSRNARRTPIVDENNVGCPGVPLNYTDNFNVVVDSSPRDQ